MDDAVFSFQVGHAKPDAEIYRMACRHLSISPDRAAFFGDGGSDELCGAADAGLTPYAAKWFINRWPEWRRGRDDLVPAAAELLSPTQLRRILAG